MLNNRKKIKYFFINLIKLYFLFICSFRRFLGSLKGLQIRAQLYKGVGAGRVKTLFQAVSWIFHLKTTKRLFSYTWCFLLGVNPLPISQKKLKSSGTPKTWIKHWVKKWRFLLSLAWPPPPPHPLLANKVKVSICLTEKDYSERGTEATILLAAVKGGVGRGQFWRQPKRVVFLTSPFSMARKVRPALAN